MTPQDPDLRASAVVGQTGRDVSRASVGELIGEVTRDLSTLMRQELALAKAEVKEEAVKAARAGGMLGAAGFAGYMVLLFASIAAWWGLAEVMAAGMGRAHRDRDLGGDRRRAVRAWAASGCARSTRSQNGPWRPSAKFQEPSRGR